jgi:uncharacterized protein
MPRAKTQRSKIIPSQKREDTPEVVDPVWLITALGFSLAGAVICGYLTLCFLYYQGSWQLLLHPDRTISETPATLNVPYTDVRFDSSETGQPRLTAWWIPAEPENGLKARYSASTILYLHGGSGSLSSTVPTLAQLHHAGLNVFAIDYRGFGASDASAHPSETRMTEDVAAAFDYLTATRHIAVEDIIPYGTGLGASLAARLAIQHPRIPAVILDNPDPDPTSTAAAQSSRLIPARFLLGNPFEISSSVSTLALPKLLIAGGANATTDRNDISRIEALFRTASSPSFAVTLPTASNASYQTSLQRFLDQYVSTK